MEGGCIEKQGKIKRKGKIMKTLVDINYEFRNMRIKHGFLLFCIFSFRTLFNTILSLVILTKPESEFFTMINSTWDVIHTKIIHNSEETVNIYIFAILTLVYVCTVIFIFNGLRKVKQIGLYGLVLIYTFNPLFVRYLSILLAGNNFAKRKELTIFYVFCCCSCFLFEFIFWLLSFNSHSKNENLLIKQRHVSVIFKEMFLFALIIVTSNIEQFGRNSQFEIFITVIYNLLSLITLCNYFLYLDTLCKSFVYHNSTSETIFTIVTCLEATASISFVISEILQDSIIQRNLDMLMLVVGLFFFIGVSGYVGYRDQKSLVEVEESESFLEVTLHVLGDCLENPNRNDRLWFAANSIKNQHAKSCEKLDCVCRRKGEDFEKNEEFEKKLIKNKIKSICSSSTSNFSLTISCCYLNLEYFACFPDLVLLLNHVRRYKELNIFEELEYECFKNEIKHFLSRRRRDMNGVEIERVQKQDDIIVFLLKYMESISHSKFTFWSCLNKTHPNISSIDECVEKATNEKKIIECKIEETLKELSFSNSIMELLCVYEVYVKLNARLPKYLLETQQKTAIIKVEKIKVLKSQNFRVDALMYEKYSMVFESQIEKNNMGIILNVSKNITKVFGYKKEDIVGQNINEIMPKSMQKEHDNILESWRERASWANVHKIRFILAMTKENVCFESVIYLTILQRNDSVNLFALFVKANENSYMIVNDEGNIDGVGMDFIDVFGHKVVKLPLTSVCLEADYIIKSAKKNKTETIDINCYHVKGLEKEIDGYQHSKYQINNSSGVEMRADLLENIKTEERCIRIKVEYKPYRMGNKEFVLIRLIEVYENEDSEDHSLGDRIENSYAEQLKSEEHNKNLTNLNIIQNQNKERDLIDLENSNNDQIRSITSSKNEEGIPWEKLLSVVEDKATNHSRLRNSQLLKYLGLIVFLCSLTVTILFVHNKTEIQAMKVLRRNTLRPSRFMFKTTSLALAYARVQNLEYMINRNMPGNKIYEIERLLTEVTKLRFSFHSEALGMFNDVYEGGDDGIEWVGLDGEKLIVNFEQFYGYYLDAAKKIRDSYIKNQTIPKEKLLILNNYKNVKPYANVNVFLISNLIINNLGTIMIVQILKVIFVICTLFLVTFSTWKSKNLEIEQRNKVYKVMLAISDRNCQNCCIYYKNIWHTIKKCQSHSKSKENESEFILKVLVEEQKLDNHLNDLFVYRDQIEKSRESKIIKNTLSKIKVFIVILSSVILGHIAYSASYEIGFLVKNQYFYEYYRYFIENENRNFYRFQLIKQIVFENQTLTPQEVELEFDTSEIFLVNNQETTKNFLDLFENLRKVFTPSAALNKYAVSSLNLCEQMKTGDKKLYLSMCQGNYTFPYERLHFVETNSIVEEYFKEIIYSFKQGVIQSQENFRKIRIIEELLTMKLTYIYGFSLTLSLWAVIVYTGNQYYNEDMRIILAGLFILLGIVTCYLIKKMNESMKDSFWVILILPEIVLRRTKRAMKYIQDLLK